MQSQLVLVEQQFLMLTHQLRVMLDKIQYLLVRLVQENTQVVTY